MDPTLVIAALSSALLHAAWNAGVKSTSRAAEAMAGQMLVSAMVGVGVLTFTGPPQFGALAWVALAAVVNVFTVGKLLRAYELSAYGIAYPVGRAVSVLLVLPLFALVLGERVGSLAVVGVGLVAASLGLLAFSARSRRGLTLAGLGWTVASGLGIALYIMCDARGVRSAGSPLAYGCAASITNALVLAWRQRRVGSPGGW
jgi:hypothetical protein